MILPIKYQGRVKMTLRPMVRPDLLRPERDVGAAAGVRAPDDVGGAARASGEQETPVSAFSTTFLAPAF